MSNQYNRENTCQIKKICLGCQDHISFLNSKLNPNFLFINLPAMKILYKKFQQINSPFYEM